MNTVFCKVFVINFVFLRVQYLSLLAGILQTDKKYKERSFYVKPFKQKKNFGNLTVRTEFERGIRNGN